MQRQVAIEESHNTAWGLWGTCRRNGFDPLLCWQVVCRFFMEQFQLSAQQTRILLDARFGRHLADELSFIEGGPMSADAITTHLQRRCADERWLRYFMTSIEQETGLTPQQHNANAKSTRLSQIANQHLGGHLNQPHKPYSNLSAAQIQRALDAAYEAGQRASTTI